MDERCAPGEHQFNEYGWCVKCGAAKPIGDMEQPDSAEGTDK